MKNLCKKILLAYLFVATYCLMAQNVFELSVSEDKKSPYDKSISQIKINSFNGIKIVDTSDGCAFSFPGNNLSAIDIGNPEILEKLVTNENYTVTLNLKTDMELKPFAKATILAKTGLGGNDGGPWLGISRDFKTGYCLYANLGDEEMYSAPVNVNDDKWHTCIYAFDLKDKTAYIVFDGKLVLKKSFSKMPSSNNFMWEIGRGRDAGGGQPYKGLLNNLTIGKDVTLPFLKSDNKQQSTTRNLLFNGSFEHGTNGWFPEFPLKIADKDIGGSYGLNQAIKPEAAYDGDVGLSIFLPEWHNQPITSSWFKVDGAGKYTVSFYAKAQNKNAKLEVKINGAFKTPHETFEIAQQWQRYTFTALIYPEQERKLLQLELCPISAEANNLFIDSIMFYPGETSALEKYSVKDPVEVSIDVCNNKKHILLDNEPCNLEITAFSEKERNVELCLDGIDFKNNPLPSISQKLTLHAGKYFKLNISRPVPGKGFFLIRATISENDKKLGENFCGIAVFDAATALLPYSKEYRVGNEFMLNDDSILFNKKMGSGIIKLMDCGSGITNWIYLEPSEGRFMFTSNNNPSRAGGEFGVNTDFIERAKYVRASGVATMGVLYRTPDWAIKRNIEKNCMVPPRTQDELNLWARYVETTIKTFSPYVDDWEVWNEPGWWGGVKGAGDARTFYDMLRVATPIIRKYAPDAKIVASVYEGKWMGDNSDDFEKFLSYGAWKYFDVVSIHGEGPGYARWVEEINSLMKKYAGKTYPIWNTESPNWGIPWFEDAYGLSLEERKTKPEHFDQAANELRMFVEQLACGITKVHHYHSDTGRSYATLNTGKVSGATCCGNGFPSVVGMALGTAAALIGECDILGSGKLYEQINYLKVAKPDGKTIIFIWLQHKGSSAYVTAQCPDIKLQQIDIMNNSRPVLPENGEFILNAGFTPLIISFENKNDASVFLKKIKLKNVNIVDANAIANRPELEKFKAISEMAYDEWRWFQIDIKPYMNMGFKDDVAGDGKGGWTDEGLNDMRDITTGKRSLYGVVFDIVDPASNNGKSCIVLRSKHTQADTFPEKVTIPIEKKITYLYFLHANGWTSSPWYYDVIYDDGSSERIQIEPSKNINDWWPVKGQVPVDTENTKVVPIVTKNLIGAPTPLRYIFILQWKNPHLAKKIKAVVISNPEKETVPILIGITGHLLEE